MMRHARAMMHVGIANTLWRGKRSRHSRRMHNPHFYASGKRPIATKRGRKAILTSLLTALETDVVMGRFWLIYESTTTGILEPYTRKMVDAITKLANTVGALKNESLAKYKKIVTLQNLIAKMETKMDGREQQGRWDSIRTYYSSLVFFIFHNDKMVIFFSS